MSLLLLWGMNDQEEHVEKFCIVGFTHLHIYENESIILAPPLVMGL